MAEVLIIKAPTHNPPRRVMQNVAAYFSGCVCVFVCVHSLDE